MSSDEVLTEDEPIYVNGKNEYEKVVSQHSLVLVDFYADWCGPCKMIEPVLETLAAETNAVIVKVDVDTNQQLAADPGVRGVPTMKLYSDGEEKERFTGAYPEDELRELIGRYDS